MDAVEKLQSELRLVTDKIAVLERDLEKLRVDRKEIEGALVTIGRYIPRAKEENITSLPLQVKRGAYAEAVLDTIKDAGANGIDTQGIKAILDNLPVPYDVSASALSVTLRRNEQKQNIKRLGKKYYLWSLAPVAPESNTQDEFSQSLGGSVSNIKEEGYQN